MSEQQHTSTNANTTSGQTDPLWNYELNIPIPDFTNISNIPQQNVKVCPGAPKVNRYAKPKRSLSSPIK